MHDNFQKIIQNKHPHFVFSTVTLFRSKNLMRPLLFSFPLRYYFPLNPFYANNNNKKTDNEIIEI